jgi:hypothetical protein
LKFSLFCLPVPIPSVIFSNIRSKSQTFTSTEPQHAYSLTCFHAVRDYRTYVVCPNPQPASVCHQSSFTEELVTTAKIDSHDMKCNVGRCFHFLTPSYVQCPLLIILPFVPALIPPTIHRRSHLEVFSDR